MQEVEVLKEGIALEQRVQRLEDIQEIANLKARYLNGADGGWSFNKKPSDPDVVVPFFAEDGVWHSESQGRAEGRAAIREAWSKFSSVMPFAIHCISNPLIDVDGDTGTGEWHVLMKGVAASGVEFWSAGIYQDTFVRTAEGWRIKETRPRLIFLGPYNEGFASLLEATKEFESGKIPDAWKRIHDKQG
jgi:ketosteroid isomerase-like protein